MQISQGRALQYATQFTCIGGDCPATCCRHWEIPIDAHNLAYIQRTLPAKLVQKAYLPCANGTPSQVAKIKLTANGSCTFFNQENGLCQLQTDYGEACLSGTCSTYPRAMQHIQQRLDFSLLLSCPEAARLCLLSADATNLIEIDPQPYLKPGHALSYRQADDDHYEQYVDFIRDSVLDLLSVSALPFASRLFIVSVLLQRLSQHLRRDASHIDAAALIQEFERITHNDTLIALHQEQEEFPQALPLSIRIIGVNLLICASRPSPLTDVIDSVMSAYGVELNHLNDLEGNINSHEISQQMAQRYQQRSQQLMSSHGERIERYFENFCRNFWFREPYTAQSSPWAHMQNMLLQLSTLRFLFVSHPRLDPIFEQLTPAAEANLLDETIVDTTYKFCRAIEHSPNFTHSIHTLLARREMDQIQHSMLLTKL